MSPRFRCPICGHWYACARPAEGICERCAEVYEPVQGGSDKAHEYDLRRDWDARFAEWLGVGDEFAAMGGQRPRPG